MLKFSEIFEFSKEKFRKIPILKEFEWFEWFEWFGPSPIEPFNSASNPYIHWCCAMLCATEALSAVMRSRFGKLHRSGGDDRDKGCGLTHRFIPRWLYAIFKGHSTFSSRAGLGVLIHESGAVIHLGELYAESGQT